MQSMHVPCPISINRANHHSLPRQPHPSRHGKIWAHQSQSRRLVLPARHRPCCRQSQSPRISQISAAGRQHQRTHREDPFHRARVHPRHHVDHFIQEVAEAKVVVAKRRPAPAPDPVHRRAIVVAPIRGVAHVVARPSCVVNRAFASTTVAAAAPIVLRAVVMSSSVPMSGVACANRPRITTRCIDYARRMEASS